MAHPALSLIAFLSLTVACGAGHEAANVDPEPHSDGQDEPQELTSAVVLPMEPADTKIQPAESEESGEAETDDSERGPFVVGGDVERPRSLGDRRPIEGLIAMMRSGDYAWGVCIFQVTISEKGEVGDVEFLKPEDLAPEVREVIAEAVQEWRFSPATRAGQPVAVYYNLLIHHCPFQRIRDDDG